MVARGAARHAGAMNTSLTLLAVATGASLPAHALAGRQETIWLDDLRSAEILARKTGKPILAVFR